MASKRVTGLKWRKVKGEWRAGPFMLVPQHKPDDGWHFVYMWEPLAERWTLIGGEELDAAKRACEILASRILGARANANR